MGSPASPDVTRQIPTRKSHHTLVHTQPPQITLLVKLTCLAERWKGELDAFNRLTFVHHNCTLGTWKGGAPTKFFVITSRVRVFITVSSSHVFTGCRRYNKTHYSSSCSPWKCQAYLWSHLPGDAWCFENISRKCGSPRLSPSACLWPFRSFQGYSRLSNEHRAYQ